MVLVDELDGFELVFVGVCGLVEFVQVGAGSVHFSFSAFHFSPYFVGFVGEIAAGDVEDDAAYEESYA